MITQVESASTKGLLKAGLDWPVQKTGDKNDDYDYEEDDDVGEEDGEDGLEEEYGGDDE